MKIAVDAMGGDYAPEQVVQGALEAQSTLGVNVLLVGDEARIAPWVRGREGVNVVHASQTIPMGAHPIEAVRKMKDSSIVVACRLVKEGKADAVVSAGSTGAAMAASLLGWGRLKGVDRPAISSLMPTLNGGVCILLDVGANADCRSNHLAHFALMGSVYAERVLGVSNPRVGLLNIGEEETKGSELALEAYSRLRTLGELGKINFVGNVEGRDILPGKADVVVCDGFVGNVVLKFGEGMAGVIFDLIKNAVTRDLRSKVGALLLKPALADIWRRMDYTEYGGAPLLGVQGVSIISHGSSNAKAVRNAIRVAKEAVEKHVVHEIQRVIEKTNAPAGSYETRE